MRFMALWLILAVISASQARAAGAYDGVWTVNMNCPTAHDGAFGYSRQFPARVVDGRLHGEVGQGGTAGWLALDGPISDGGRGTLLGHGLTGKSAYAVGHPAELTPYQFHLDAQFTGAGGTGERMEVRRCSFQFSRAS